MSVLIKGMEMPISCDKCPMSLSMVIFSEGAIHHCLLLKGTANRELCPLVPVPAHGRLIDAGALLERLKGTARYFDLKYDIVNAPTIIEAEEGK